MSGRICQWKPFWILVGESFQKAYLEEWIYTGDDSYGEQGMANIPTLVQGAGYKDYTSIQKRPEEAPSAPRSAGQPDALTLESVGPQGTASFWERLELPFPSAEILSGFEDIVSSGTDQFTAWVETDPDATLVRHMVDVQEATADFREASERRHDTSSQAYRFNKKLSNRSLVHKRLSIYNWNPGPRRGKEGPRPIVHHLISSHLMERVDDESDVPISPRPATSSNVGSPNGSGPDLDGMGHRSFDAQFKELRFILLPLAR